MTIIQKSPLISIIIPVYNDRNFLKKCLDSVLQQDYSNLEIILVDDGSGDGSSQILDDYAQQDTRIRVFHKENAGVSEARNLGIRKANGKYICFSDADDILSTNYVSYLLKLIQKDNADIALTTRMFNSFSKKQVTHVKEKIINNENASIDILCYRIPIGVYSKMFRSDFLRKNKIKFRHSLCMGEGFNFNIDAFQRANKIMISNIKIYFYRRDNPESVTTSFSMKRWQNGLYAVKLIKHNMIIRSTLMLKAWQYAYWRTCSDVFDSMKISGADKIYKKEFKRLKKIVQKKATYAWKVPVRLKDKIRALILMFIPSFIPWLMKQRNKLHDVSIRNKQINIE